MMSADIQIGLLLPSEAGIRQILGRSAASHCDSGARIANFLQLIVSIQDL